AEAPGPPTRPRSAASGRARLGRRRDPCPDPGPLPAPEPGARSAGLGRRPSTTNVI
ncbi:MAG: hypothetical protein AVDCRST_MAG73-1595, partial [uncultured Thermomicrobiales bacterium]